MTIKVYGWRDPEFQNMVKVVEELQDLTGGSFQVATTWFDLGQDWYWTTILSRKPEYQMLNPKQQEEICNGDFSCVKELAKDWFKLRRMELENELSALERREEAL